MNCGVYSIKSPSGKQYIGSSKKISKRWYQHIQQLRTEKHYNQHLQNAWNKYRGALEFKTLLVCEENDLLFYEQLVIDGFKPEYNICTEAGRPSSAPITDETRKKVSLSLIGNKRSLGSSPSIETRNKISKSLIGNKRATAHRGKTKSPTHREALSKAGLGHPVSQETRQKISEAFRKKRELKNVL